MKRKCLSLFLAIVTIISLYTSPAFAYSDSLCSFSEVSQDVLFSLEDAALNEEGEYELIIPLNLYSNDDIALNGGEDFTGDFDVFLRLAYGPALDIFSTTVYVRRFNGEGVVSSATATFSYTIFDHNKKRLSSNSSSEILKDKQSFSNVSVNHVFHNVNFDEANNYVAVSAIGTVNAIGSSIGGYYTVAGDTLPK